MTAEANGWCDEPRGAASWSGDPAGWQPPVWTQVCSETHSASPTAPDEKGLKLLCWHIWRPDRLGTCCSPYDAAPGWRRGGARPERRRSPGSTLPDRRGQRPLYLWGEVQVSLSSADICWKCPCGLTCAQMLIDSSPHLLRLLQLGAVQWGQELRDTQLLPGHPADRRNKTRLSFFTVMTVHLFWLLFSVFN